MKHRTSVVLLMLFLCTSASLAQERIKDDELCLELRSGHNSVFGYFTAASLQTLQTFDKQIMLNAGLQYNTIGKTSLEARPAYYRKLNWGQVSAELLLAYNHFKIDSFAAGAGVGVSGKWIGGKLGYYYRIFGNGQSWIKEPFNVYYEFWFNALAKVDKWNLHLSMTNSEMFELERHYQPSFIAKCSYYPMNELGIKAGLGCSPAGIFNIAADYYHTFITLGVCYIW